jgi:hypothetical protein
LQKRCKEFLKHHEWLAVPLEGGVSRSGLLSNSSSSSATSSSASSAKRHHKGLSDSGAVARGTALIHSIRDDLLRLQPITLQVLQVVFRWRQDQALTQDERRNPQNYPPKPFVYNGHDYLLKMVHDLNFLKEVQPITAWLGQPLSRNPFALLATDPNGLDNLEMQFEGSVADLAACSHTPPPRVQPEMQQKALVHWGSLLLLAQEAIYGRGPDPMDMSTEGGGTTRSVLAQGGSFAGVGGKLAMGSNMVTGSLFSNPSVAEEAAESFPDSTSKAAKYSNMRANKKSGKKGISTVDGRAKKKGKGGTASSAVAVEASRAKTLSRVHQVISQNATLRRELLRMRGALEMERETLRRLEMTEGAQDDEVENRD